MGKKRSHRSGSRGEGGPERTRGKRREDRDEGFQTGVRAVKRVIVHVVVPSVAILAVAIPAAALLVALVDQVSIRRDKNDRMAVVKNRRGRADALSRTCRMILPNGFLIVWLQPTAH